MAFYGGMSRECQDWSDDHSLCNGRDDKYSPYACACSCHRDHTPPLGWKCIIEHSVPRARYEPCGLVPRWWNLRDRWKYRKLLS